jgi:hypothetical protein
MKKDSFLISLIFLIFCSMSVVAQSSYWVTTDAGNQMEVFPVQSLKSGSSAAASGSNSLTTLFASDNWYAGNMFDVEVVGSSSIFINSFDINIEASNNSTCTIRVYYKEDTYVGSQATSGDWTLVSEIPNVVPQGANSPTHISTDNIILEAGNTYGFYITVTDYPSANMLYTNGSNVYNNEDIEIRTGYGINSPDFSGFNDQRSWNGTIYYSTAPLVPFSIWAVIMAFLLITLTVLYKKKRLA